ncbi:hypothetical protein AVEN_129590-1 [Araneus ventricosus]|uniref:Uncharacterized protein n=1 Tax=Araneus ventricosus TaxID=182803 RepID=A0A4Y2U727_ARAVE|nr:hypothetical protein AVEN_129590-1 [Araneus ventricosus]
MSHQVYVFCLAFEIEYCFLLSPIPQGGATSSWLRSHRRSERGLSPLAGIVMVWGRVISTPMTGCIFFEGLGRGRLWPLNLQPQFQTPVVASVIQKRWYAN